MNRQIIQSMLSRIILGSGAVLLLPLLLSLYYGGPVLSFLIPALLALVLSLMLRKKNISPNVSLTPREGTAITALSWLSVSLLYAIPYILSGTLSPLDGLVESVSGLTGTGATVINDLSPVRTRPTRPPPSSPPPCCSSISALMMRPRRSIPPSKRTSRSSAPPCAPPTRSARTFWPACDLKLGSPR